MNVQKEIELAIKRENPNWDGKSFDYGIAIYKNVLDCWEAVAPLIEKAGHSGYSYGMFVNIFKRVLDEKVLTPITDEDFFSEPQKIEESPEYLKEAGLKSSLQCPRYSALFRKETLDGKVSYSDVDRITIIDQHNSWWHCGWAERCCKKHIPEITMPYFPSDKKIKIYVWQFMYDPTTNPSVFVERGSYNAMFIEKIVFPDDKKIDVNELYLENTENHDTPVALTPELYDTIKKVIEEDKIAFEKELESVA